MDMKSPSEQTPDDIAALIRSANFRYIKLGPGNRWADEALAREEIYLGHKEVPHEIASSGDRSKITAFLVGTGKSSGKAADFAREIVDFYRLGPDTIWITFEGGRLWWTVAGKEVTWLGEDDRRGARMRRALFPWRDTNVEGEALLQGALSTRLTKVTAYRQTLCKIGEEDYLRRKLLGESDPKVEAAYAARKTMIEAASALIGSLHWADFETLVDLVLSRGGWHRVSALGGTQKDADIVVEQPITGETAFVQVKSKASQALLDDYVGRFEANPEWSRMIFACHSPTGAIDTRGHPRVILWDRAHLSEAVIRTGLYDWLVERAG
jgi:hypothetical protein